MPLSCSLNDVNAAFMQYEEGAGAVSAVTGGRGRLCGTTGTAAQGAQPFKITRS
jgi:hypothetical protein